MKDVSNNFGEEVMISSEEKDKIKKDIVEKINSVLEKNGESFRLDQVNVLNKKETVKFMGNYRVYDRKNYGPVSKEINSFLKQYGDVDIKSKKIRDSGMKFTTVSFNFELWIINTLFLTLTWIKSVHVQSSDFFFFTDIFNEICIYIQSFNNLMNIMGKFY